MDEEKAKILTNILISAGGNHLKLVHIVFKDKIEQIIPQRDRTIDWREISTKEKWEKFKTEITPTDVPPATKIYDGKYLLLMPGAIDSHVHFNTPGFEDRDDFEHGSLAAAYGGVTTVIDMPCTSIPPVTSIKNLKKKVKAIDGKSWVDYAFWGGVSGNDFRMSSRIKEQILQLIPAGVVGFKAYLISGMDSFTDLTYEQMANVAEIIESNKSILAVHAEDKYWVVLNEIALQNKGLNDWRAYCQARDDLVEGKAIAKMIGIARRTNCTIHIVHLSSQLGLEQIRKAQKQGLNLSTETCPHYLYFTEDDFQDEAITNFLKTTPPVKKAVDREALWKGLSDGTISFVTTDHAGCDPIKEKSYWNFWEVYGGIPGVEHRVPFLFSEGFKSGRLTLSQTIALLSENVAKFFRLDSKGSLEMGNDADMALINLWDQQVIRADRMHSKGKYTPFEGVTFDAVVDSTFLRGKRIMNRRSESEVNLGYGKPIFISQ